MGSGSQQGMFSHHSTGGQSGKITKHKPREAKMCTDCLSYKKWVRPATQPTRNPRHPEPDFSP